ncbi:MAG: amidohydrolase family protein [Phycisphaerales bacterium]|nr:amidohydrolase family protein [Phycisphaerales bacterium]
MAQPQTTTITGHLVLPDGEERVRLAPGVLTIRGERIESVREGPIPDSGCDFGGPGCLISPGFIDAHLHLPQFDSIGVEGLELLEWLDRVIFPAEARWADAGYAGQMAGRVARQLLSFGTTGIGAYATVHAAAAQAAIDAVAEAGLAGHVGQVLMDRGAPPELVRPAKQLIEEASNLKGRGRIVPAVTPRFAISCSDDLLRGAGELAAKTGQLIQTHLAETTAEIREVGRLCAGLRYTEVYARAGLLTPRSILGHGVHLDEQDRQVLARAGAVIAHCPTANRFLRAGMMDLAAHGRAGVAVAVGSDVAGGPDRSMVRVARAMMETARQLGHSGPSASEAWWRITRGNARCLGVADQTGSLEPGRWADVVLVRPDLEWRAGPDPIGTVVWGWDDRWVERVWVAGRAVPA